MSGLDLKIVGNDDNSLPVDGDTVGDQFAKWQLPDEVVFVKKIPKTSVGKLEKKHFVYTMKIFFWKMIGRRLPNDFFINGLNVLN